MTDREKLVGIMGELPTVFCDCCGEDYSQNKMLRLADHLIANGVTANNWRDAKTDPPPIGKEVVMLFSDESSAIGWLEDIEEDGEPVWNVCVEKGWYTTSTCCPEKWQPRPALPQKKEEPHE